MTQATKLLHFTTVSPQSPLPQFKIHIWLITGSLVQIIPLRVVATDYRWLNVIMADCF